MKGFDPKILDLPASCVFAAGALASSQSGLIDGRVSRKQLAWNEASFFPHSTVGKSQASCLMGMKRSSSWVEQFEGKKVESFSSCLHMLSYLPANGKENGHTLHTLTHNRTEPYPNQIQAKLLGLFLARLSRNQRIERFGQKGYVNGHVIRSCFHSPLEVDLTCTRWCTHTCELSRLSLVGSIYWRRFF